MIKSHPDYIASILTGKTLTAYNLSRISDYLNCSSDYLVKGSIIEQQADDNDVIPPKDIILNVLSKAPGNDEYRYLQVRISTIVISNLAKKNITMDKLLEIKLAEKKIRDFYDLTMPAENKKGLNFSDLVRISEAFNVSYDYMLTGRESA